MTIRIGIIGAGGIAGAHINALNTIDNADIVAVSDIEKDKAEERAQLAKAEPFTDFREMLDKKELDALWICTPPNVRCEPIEAAIAKNIPVFTEKPVADNPETAREISEKIAQAKLPVMVGYVLRYMKITDEAKEAIDEDNISLVNSIYCSPMSLDYRDGKPVRKWFYNKEISGGAIADQATHLFDRIRYLIDDVEDVYSLGSNIIVPKDDEYTVEDAYAIAFRFKNGTVGTHGHTWGHYGWRSTIDLYGEKGMYSLNFNEGTFRVTNFEGKTYLDKPEDHAMTNEDQAFVDMVESGDFSGIKSTFSDGVKTLELTTKCLELLNLPLQR